MVKYSEAREIMGRNFIGKEEIQSLHKFNVPEGKIPDIKYPKELLKRVKNEYILLLAIPITLIELRDIFGIDPNIAEPCFYNQDWYLKEKFANDLLECRWHLVKKTVKSNTRGKNPQTLSFGKKQSLPTCTLAAFTFFCNYLLNKEVLWQNDFIWCKDKDHNKDQIYVGRYQDKHKINKNGFNVHRHLRINKGYGAINSLSD